MEGVEENQAASYRIEKWKEGEQRQQIEAFPSIRENLLCETALQRKDWVALNRARVKV